MRRKSIKLLQHEDKLLQQLHRESRIPVDQWAQRPKFFSRFTNGWNDLSGRNDTGDDIRHYVITKRKAKKWFRFEDEYDPLRSPDVGTFTEAEWEALRKVYVKLEVGRDQFAADEDLRGKLEDGFYKLTGRRVPGNLLYAAAMAMQKHRKNGWPQVSAKPKKGRGFGFKDIDDVA